MTGLLDGTATRYAALLGGDAEHGQAAALESLWSLTWREAQVLTYADGFLVIAICFVIATAMVPLMRRPPHARQRQMGCTEPT